MKIQIAQVLNTEENQIVEIREWVFVYWVKVAGRRPTLVSKKKIMTYPKMQGSEKQCKWAESIREAFIEEGQQKLEDGKRFLNQCTEDGDWDETFMEGLKTEIALNESVLDALKRYAGKASFLIDARDWGWKDLCVSFDAKIGFQNPLKLLKN